MYVNRKPGQFAKTNSFETMPRKKIKRSQCCQGENKTHWNVRDILRTGQDIPGFDNFHSNLLAIRFGN